jgi:hypothetical protein
MKARSVLGILLLSLLSYPAFADFQGQLPEPGVLELLALGGLVAAVVGIRNRRK